MEAGDYPAQFAQFNIEKKARDDDNWTVQVCFVFIVAPFVKYESPPSQRVVPQ